MDNLILVKPTTELKEQALDYRQEHFEKGEKIINGSALLDNLTYEEWLEHLEKSSNPDTVSKLVNKISKLRVGICRFTDTYNFSKSVS